MASDFELATWQKTSLLEDNFILQVEEREIASVKFSPFYQKLTGAPYAFISFDQFRFEVVSGKTWLKQFNVVDHENAIVAHTKSTLSGYGDILWRWFLLLPEISARKYKGVYLV